MTTLISFGCSHTAGGKLMHRRTPECKKLTPAKIANHYGMDYENHAQVDVVITG